MVDEDLLGPGRSEHEEHPHGVHALVLEAVAEAPRNVDAVARDGGEPVVAVQELQLAVEHVEGLLLLGVGHPTVPPQVEYDLTDAGREAAGHHRPGRALDRQAPRGHPQRPGGMPWPMSRHFLTD